MKANILVVDDQAGILLLLKEILELEGYTVMTAKTGREALEAARNHIIHLILLDYIIPVKNGLEVVRQIEKENIPIPIIVMSGLPEKINESIKEYAQIVAILPKPFDIEEVTELVHKNMAQYN